LRAPASANAVIRVSQARIEPSATPASMSARMRLSMPALSSLMRRLIAAPRCWSSARQHAPAEVPDDRGGIAADESEQPLARRACRALAFLECRLDLRETRPEAFEQDGLLVRHI
jgi:hypothetical protein